VLDHHYHGGTQVTLDDEKYDFDKVNDTRSANRRHRFIMLVVWVPKFWQTDWQVTQDIFRFLDALNIEKVHLLGVALGSAIAVRMAMLHIERVLSLTLCSMGPPAPVRISFFAFKQGCYSKCKFDWRFILVDDQNPDDVAQHRAMLEMTLSTENDDADAFPDMVSAGMKTLFGRKGQQGEPSSPSVTFSDQNDVHWWILSQRRTNKDGWRPIKSTLWTSSSSERSTLPSSTERLRLQTPGSESKYLSW
jgi:pimeloyl-ACP methyl ester carboxylesterase